MHISTRRQLARRLFGAASNSVRSSSPAEAPPPASLERQLLARATFGANRDVANDLRAMGPDAWLEQQLHPDTITDAEVELKVANAMQPWENTAPDMRMLIRALYSRRQLAWRMVYFLNNHFATYQRRTQPISESNEDDRFYTLCFSHFETVLRASATSPAMIDFLDSGSNIAGSPNENYARELLELHTISINGGYTQVDVEELSRVFTGWSRTNVSAGVGAPVTNSYFTFDPATHDAGPKSLPLGWSTPGFAGFQGRQEGAEVLRFLANHPRTATFFTKKLCLFFVGDDPPIALLGRVQQVFQATQGSLRDTVRAVFMDPEFASASAGRSKTHDGFEYVVGVLRRIYKGTVNLAEIRTRIAALRSLPHGSPSPKGHPETGPAWHGPGNLLPRWQFADDYAHDRIPATAVPWTKLFPQIPTDGRTWVRGLEEHLFDLPLPDATTWALELFMDERVAPFAIHPTWAQVRPHAQALLSIMLQLPEMQLH